MPVESRPISELLSLDTPKRGALINVATGLAIIEACREDWRLLRFIRWAESQLTEASLTTVYRRRTQDDLSPPERQIILDSSTRSIGIVGQMSVDKNMRAVIMWNEHQTQFTPKLWVGFYNKRNWQQAVTHGERGVGNFQIDSNPSSLVRDFASWVADIVKHRGLWTTPVSTNIDPLVPSVMGMLAGFPGPALVLDKHKREVGIYDELIPGYSGQFQNQYESFRRELEETITH